MEEADIPALRGAFEKEYRRQFSRAVPGMKIEILNWALQVSSEPPALASYPEIITNQRAQPTGQRRILCELTGEWREAETYDRSALNPGDHLEGPALIIEPQTTTFVSTDFSARVDGGGNIWLKRNREGNR